jgi:hypothetical protein
MHQVEARERGPGALRGLYRTLFRRLPTLRRYWIGLCCHVDALPPEAPDILIASGGKSIFAARYLADRFRAALIYCGSPAPYPCTWFDCILSTEPAPDGADNHIHTDVLINSISPGVVAAAARDNPLPAGTDPARIGTVLIGGRSRSQQFGAADWRELGRQLNLLHHRDGWRWLIATSRRTGRDTEQLLREIIEPAAVIDAVWWAENPRRVVRPWLGHGRLILVGRDSMTMVSEALCSGRPVVVLRPQSHTPSRLVDGFFTNLGEKRLLQECLCRDLAAKICAPPGHVPLSASPVPLYARQVIDMLATGMRASTSGDARKQSRPQPNRG